MKKTSFVIAILASAMLAGACSGGSKKAPAQTTPNMTEGSASGSGEGMAPAGSGSDAAPAPAAQ